MTLNYLKGGDSRGQVLVPLVLCLLVDWPLFHVKVLIDAHSVDVSGVVELDVEFGIVGMASSDTTWYGEVLKAQASRYSTRLVTGVRG